MKILNKIFKIHQLKHGESPNATLRSLGVPANYPDDIVYNELVDRYVSRKELPKFTQ